jgi:hypothetical protein
MKMVFDGIGIDGWGHSMAEVAFKGLWDRQQCGRGKERRM